MYSPLASFFSSVLISKKTWSTYSIKTTPEESYEMHSFEQFSPRSATPQPTLNIDTSPILSAISPSATPSSDTDQATTTFTPAVPAAPPAIFNSPPASHLGTAGIAGLSTAISILVLLIAYAVLELCVVKKRRREKALRRAVQEVEQGSVRSDSIRSEVKSREGFVVDGKDDWEVVVGEVEVWEGNEGRNGMSLPRRFW